MGQAPPRDPHANDQASCALLQGIQPSPLNTHAPINQASNQVVISMHNGKTEFI